MHPDPVNYPNWETFVDAEAQALHDQGIPHHFYTYTEGVAQDDPRQLLCVSTLNKDVPEDWYCVDVKTNVSCPDCLKVIDQAVEKRGFKDDLITPV